MEQSYWMTNVASASAGVVVGALALLGSLKGAGRSAQAIEYGAISKRLSDMEARADQMSETIFQKDRQLIAALDDAAEARAAMERAVARATAAEHRVDELEVRCGKLENAFDELLQRTRMPAAERERLRTMYRSAMLSFTMKE